MIYTCGTPVTPADRQGATAIAPPGAVERAAAEPSCPSSTDSPMYRHRTRCARRLIASWRATIFRSSPQLAAFLSFVVEAALQGRSDRIKGYTIGVEALRRDTNFDPQTRPHRARRGDAPAPRHGALLFRPRPGDAVRIGLPRGIYVPTFHRRTEIVDKEPDDERLRRWLGARPPAVPALLPCWRLCRHHCSRRAAARRHRPSTPRPRLPGRSLQPGNGLRRCLFSHLPSPGRRGRSISATSLYTRLTTPSRDFDTINIRWQSGGDRRRSGTANSLTPVAHRLSPDGLGRISRRRHRAACDSGCSIPSTAPSYGRGCSSAVAGAEDRAAAEDAIVTNSPPRWCSRSASSARTRNKSICCASAIRAIAASSRPPKSFRSFDPDQHARARPAWNISPPSIPIFASGFSYLAAIYFREYQYGYDGHAGDPAALDRALRWRARAIELKPENSRAYRDSVRRSVCPPRNRRGVCRRRQGDRAQQIRHHSR